MGARLTYRLDPVSRKNDNDIIEYCQSLILFCLPNFNNVHIKEFESKRFFFEALTEDQINKAFESSKMDYKYHLEILQKCDIAYNEPSILKLIDSLIKNKNFFLLNEQSNKKRLLSKKIIDDALYKHLNKVMPKELKFLIKDPYFIRYISEVFLPLEKNRIIITIEKYFELSLLDKNSLSLNLQNYQEQYEIIKSRINKYRIRYDSIMQKYKNDPEYQTIEKIQSVQMAIDIQKEKNKEMIMKNQGEDFTLEKTVDNLDW